MLSDISYSALREYDPAPVQNGGTALEQLITVCGRSGGHRRRLFDAGPSADGGEHAVALPVVALVVCEATNAATELAGQYACETATERRSRSSAARGKAMQKLKEKPYYTRIALLGIGMYLLIEAVILIVTLATEPSEWAYACIVGGIALALGAVIYFVRPWGLIVGVLGGLLGILFAIDGLGENLSSPDSFLDFAYRPVFGLAAAVFVLVGSSAGLVQHFRGRTSTGGPAMVTIAVKGVLGLVAVLSLFSAILTVAGIHGVSAADKAGATTITAHVTKYDTDTLMAAANGTTKVVFKNEDPIVHTFTIDALDIDVKVGPGSEKLFELKSLKPGTYEFYCRITGHKEQMHGTLTVP
jgi:plastocyanin